MPVAYKPCKHCGVPIPYNLADKYAHRPTECKFCLDGNKPKVKPIPDNGPMSFLLAEICKRR